MWARRGVMLCSDEKLEQVFKLQLLKRELIESYDFGW